MKWTAGLKECMILGIMAAGALLFLDRRENAAAEVSFLPARSAGYEEETFTGLTPSDHAGTGQEPDGPDAAQECRGKIALTFDDGPHPQYTEQLLDGLKKRGVKATFFVTGEHAELHPEIIKRMSEEGHCVGNHTYSHMQLKESNKEAFKQELIKTNEIITGITGEEVLYVRPPYGTWDKKFETELNMFPVLWNIEAVETENMGKYLQRLRGKIFLHGFVKMGGWRYNKEKSKEG